jgi:lysophospholipase L1-like esterase
METSAAPHPPPSFVVLRFVSMSGLRRVEQQSPGHLLTWAVMHLRMRSPWLLAAIATLTTAASFLTSGCGGNTTTPPPVTPTPPAELFPVVGLVFQDDNGDGVRGANEPVVMPSGTVSIGGSSGAIATNGSFTVSAPRGTQTVGFTKLPPYFLPGAPTTVDVPQAAGSQVMAPVVLPLGKNNLGLYLAYGDSISLGTGSSDGRGYRPALASRLRATFGRATIEYRGGAGSGSGLEGTTAQGAFEIERHLSKVKPAFILIMWGVNDYYNPACSDPTAASCPSMDNLRTMIQAAKSAQSMPVLATITTSNTGYSNQAPASRNVWVAQYNERVRALAQQEQVLLADMEAAFLAQGNPPSLFVDHIHPSDAGYDVIAETYAAALISGSVAGATSF